jgi:hypothetical protein
MPYSSTTMSQDPLILIRTTPWHEERYGWAKTLQDGLPAELIEDTTHNSLDTLTKAFLYQQATGVQGAWHIEDDAELTSRWLTKARWVLAAHPGTIIQAFSSGSEDLKKGERWRKSHWGSSLCFYWPSFLLADVIEFISHWEKPPHKKLRNNDDMITDFIRDRDLRYWNTIPSLATHRAGPSMRHNGRHWPERRSPTFVP